jgi:sulfur carrier protein
MITIHLNGKETQLERAMTIAELLQQLELKREGIAVALNHRVVPRTAHAHQTVSDQAQVEIIRAVGGG